MMKAHTLYSIRSLTGCISGQELSELFSIMLGDPSPSGSTDLPLGQWHELMRSDPRAAALRATKEAIGYHSRSLDMIQVLFGHSGYRNRLAQAYAVNGLWAEAERAEAENADWQAEAHFANASRNDIPFPYAFLGW